MHISLRYDPNKGKSERGAEGAICDQVGKHNLMQEQEGKVTRPQEAGPNLLAPAIPRKKNFCLLKSCLLSL